MSASRQTVKAGRGRLARYAGILVATFETPTTRLVAIPDGVEFRWGWNGPVLPDGRPAAWRADRAVTRAGVRSVGR